MNPAHASGTPSSASDISPEEQLRAENAALRQKLDEAEDTLRAIRTGDVDSIVVETKDGPQLFTLQGIDAASNQFRGEILAQVGDAVIAVDAEQRVIYLNAAAERQYRVAASDTLGRQLGEVYTQQWSGTETAAGMSAALHERGEWRGEMVHRSHDGRDIAVETSVTTLRDAIGTPAGYVGVYRDITERKQAQEMLRNSEERYRRVVETAHEGIWTIDAQGRITYVNQRMADLLGYSPAELMGRVHTDFMWEEDRPKGEVNLELHRQGLPQVLDQRYRRQDDSELWTVASGSAFSGPDGVFTGALGMFTDITERKQTEEALRDSEARYRSLFENMLNGFAYCQMHFDEQGQPDDFVYLAVNDTFEKLTGLENVTGKRVSQVFPEIKELNPELFDTYGRVASTGQPERFEVDFKPLGLRLSVSVYCPMTGYFVAVFDDITQRTRSEAALRESEQRFRIMADGLPLMIWVHDTQGALQFVNQTYRDFFGVTPEQVCGPNWQPLVHPDDLAAYAGEFSACVQDRRPFHSLVRARRLEGDWRWLESRAQPRFSTSGEFLGMVGGSTDITERKQAEDALRGSQQFTRSVLENLFAFVGVMASDGTLLYANRAPVEAAGIPASEVLGKKFWDCFWWSYSPEIQVQLRDACERAASGEVVRYDVPVRMVGDTRIWIDFQVAPLRDTEGRITHLIPSAMDIAVRRAAEEKLRASEERTQLATEATAVGVWERNVHTDALRWDAQMFRLYGIAPTADGFVHYSDWSGAVLPEDLPEQERILQDTVRHGGKSRREFRIHRRDDGAVRHIESVETVRVNAQGETEWVVGTNLDVTDRKTAEIQLRQLAADLSETDRRKDEFLATLAHELRNPLAPMRNGLQLMKLAGGQPATIEKARFMMERQLTQMVRLIDDLMEVSRISLGKLKLHKERLPLATVLNSAVETTHALIDEMGQELTVTIPDEPLVVDGDMARLVQVFANLLSNAAKYGNRGGHIRLTVERQGSDVVVTVKDTGIGIAATQLLEVFEMFTQLDASLEKSQGGLGIGLTLVKRLVALHGGSIHAHSDGPGTGSEFIVRLPVVSEESAVQAPDVDDAPAATKSLLRILVVDDNRDAADSLSEMLKMMGHDTRTAYDGQQGVDLAGEYRPDVILLDIGLPRLNGYEACRLIREQPKGNGVVMIAVTGWGQDEDRRRSHEAGFDHHMVKPVDPQALMSMIAVLNVAHADQPTSRFD